MFIDNTTINANRIWEINNEANLESTGSIFVKPKRTKLVIKELTKTVATNNWSIILNSFLVKGLVVP